MKKTVLALIMVIFCSLVVAQTLNDYRSNGTGNWNAIAVWQRYNGSAWVAATAFPTNSTANIITILSPHVVTVTASVSVDQTVIDSGGKVIVNASQTLTVANGAAATDMQIFGTLENKGTVTATGKIVYESTGIYVHNRNGGTINTATWNNGSTCVIQGLTSTAIAGGAQTFYNLTWSCAGQTANFTTATNAFRTIRGKLLVVSTGTGRWTWNGIGITSKSIGTYEQTGGFVDISASSYNTLVDLNGDFVMSGGTFQQSGTSTGCKWIFKYPGQMVVDHSAGTISGTISVYVYSGTTLDVVNNPLMGSGSFNLLAGAGLIIRDAGGITSSGATGVIQMTGTRTYNAEADYFYMGTIAQSTGNGLPANVHDLTVDNANGVTLTNPVTVNGIYYEVAGALSSPPSVDGYRSVDQNYLSFEESGEIVNNFSVTVTTPNYYPNWVSRLWSINGTFTGDKYVTFYWNETDDYGFDWAADLPAVYQGTVKLSAESYDTDSDPSWVTVIMTNTFTKATYRIGTDSGDTLPIELSSFTAVLTNTGRVRIQWITQSETGNSGYHILRNDSEVLDSAELISGLIPATNSSYAHTYIFEDTELNGLGTYYYWLESQFMDGTNSFFGPLQVNVTEDGGVDVPVIPSFTRVKGIYPNPFNPNTTLKYELVENELVSLKIFDTRGQLIRDYPPASVPPGPHRIAWDGTDSTGRSVASGIYFFHFQAGKYSNVRKAILVK